MAKKPPLPLSESDKQWFRQLTHSYDQGAIDLAPVAIKAAMFLNGAAAIAIMAFMAQVWQPSGEQPAIIKALQTPLWMLVVGAFISAVTAGASYMTMFCYSWWLSAMTNQNNYRADPKAKFSAFGFHGLSVLLTIAAYVFFGLAAWEAAGAFTADQDRRPPALSTETVDDSVDNKP